MNKIKLDPGKLLGFKIIASNDATMSLHSPKIGDKQCAVVGTAPVAANTAGARSEA